MGRIMMTYSLPGPRRRSARCSRRPPRPHAPQDSHRRVPLPARAAPLRKAGRPRSVANTPRARDQPFQASLNAILVCLVRARVVVLRYSLYARRQADRRKKFKNYFLRFSPPSSDVPPPKESRSGQPLPAGASLARPAESAAKARRS